MLNETERSKLHSILAQDPVWSAYALADLQPEFDPYCQWTRVQAGDADGLVLIFTGLEPPILLTVGPAAAVEEALKVVSLPEQVYVSAQDEHFPLVETLYDLGDDARPMFRMGLQDQEALRANSRTDAVRLTRNDEVEINQLLSLGGPFTPDAYDPFQLNNGIFCGIKVEGELVAMGGTHIVDWQQGIGAVGNMYTHPEHRGQGHGSAILQAVVSALLDRDVSNIVLNVDQRNVGAQRIYKRLGFVMHGPFMEGIGRRIYD